MHWIKPKLYESTFDSDVFSVNIQSQSYIFEKKKNPKKQTDLVSERTDMNWHGKPGWNQYLQGLYNHKLDKREPRGK